MTNAARAPNTLYMQVFHYPNQADRHGAPATPKPQFELRSVGSLTHTHRPASLSAGNFAAAKSSTRSHATSCTARMAL